MKRKARIENNKMIEELVRNFRLAIEKGQDEGIFSSDNSFHRFPHGCCGDASDLLGQYLLENGIKTWYVCGNHYPTGGTEEENWEGIQSHAWLTTDDSRQTDQYQIIDITGDQFRNDPEYFRFNEPVFIGSMNRFHQLFEVEDRDIHENKGISALGGFAAPRLWNLYYIIIERM